MKLVERESPLAALHEYANDARVGEGRFVLLSGEAGVGKSSVVEQFQRELSDAAWVWTGCDGLSTPRPLAPLFDAAAALGGRLLDLVERNAERNLLFRALLDQLTGAGPISVLVIEDVHWADEATLDLIRFLARRIRTASVLLLVSYRDDALATSAPLRLSLGDLASLRWTRRIELAPLSPAGVQALAAESTLDSAELYALTEGNPFYIGEMIAAGSHAVPLSARCGARSDRTTQRHRQPGSVDGLTRRHPHRTRHPHLGRRMPPGNARRTRRIRASHRRWRATAVPSRDRSACRRRPVAAAPPQERARARAHGDAVQRQRRRRPTGLPRRRRGRSRRDAAARDASRGSRRRARVPPGSGRAIRKGPARGGNR